MSDAVVFPERELEAVLMGARSAFFGEMGPRQSCKKIHRQETGIVVEHGVVRLRVFSHMRQMDQRTCEVPAVQEVHHVHRGKLWVVVALRSSSNGVGEQAMIADSGEAEEKTGLGDVHEGVSKVEAVVE